ncbi:hypothetical protein SAMN04488030_0185 [Aliiroseovarius halocynthiae]|nr:hypothetical protein SAMN04488030_0185 [Aliiroseovarius halocynthiae]
MTNFASIKRFKGFLDLFGARGNGESGFQGAHVTGDAFWGEHLKFLDDLNEGLSPRSQDRLGANIKIMASCYPNRPELVWACKSGQNSEHL